MNSSKEEEFALFQSEVKKLKLINPQNTKDEKAVNLKTFGISETNN